MIKFIFWFNFGLIVYIYFGYPLTIAILAKMTKKAPINRADITPLVSLLIPAYNEEKVIKDKLENSLSLDYPKAKLEIIVISDCSNDKTDEIVGEFRRSGIKLIRQDKRQGKIAALNRAVPEAKGEIIVFTDANSMYKKDAVKKLVRNFNDERVGCVCGELKYTTQGVIASSAEAGESLYWRYERFIKIQESRLHSLLIANGSIYAIRKEFFLPIDEALADDFANPMRIARKGLSVIYEPEAVTVEKASNLLKEQFRQKVRIMTQGYKASFGLKKEIFSSGFLRIFEFFFHKFLRWFVPFFLIIIFISNLFLLVQSFYKIIFISQFIFYGLALFGHLFMRQQNLAKVFYVPTYFCMVNLASLIGVLNFFTSTQRVTWAKSKSTR